MRYTDPPPAEGVDLSDDELILPLRGLVEGDGRASGVDGGLHHDLLDAPGPEGRHLLGLCPTDPLLAGLYAGDLNPVDLIPALRGDMVPEAHDLVFEHLHAADLRLRLAAHDRLDGEDAGFGGLWYPVDLAADAALHHQFGGFPENLVFALLFTGGANDTHHSLAIEVLT